MKKNVASDACPILPGVSKQVETNMQDGKTGSACPSRSGKELALPQLYFKFKCLTPKFIACKLS